MKKLALMAIAGMGFVLAGCGGSADFDDTKGTITNWRLEADVKDINSNQILKKGTYVICDNGITKVQTPVTWTAGTERIELWARGLQTGEVKVVGSYPIKDPLQDDEGTIVFDFERGIAPQSINVQSIEVNPVTRNVDIKGFTNLGVRTVSSTGFKSTIKWSNYKYPVLNCTTD